MIFENFPSNQEFHRWIFSDRENKTILYCSCLTIIIQFIWFKFNLVYPNFVDESYIYLEAATNNDFINKLPTGYSKYLQLTGLLGHSHLFTVVLQYLFLEVAILFFFFTIRRLFNPG